MRVICLVPSITETLIECGVEVVGRTRFCIHPAEQVSAIEKVGGTKDINWERCKKLEPDLVIFDREENLKEMADSCPFPWQAVHITSVDNISEELITLSKTLNNTALHDIAMRWQAVAQTTPPVTSIDKIPGMLEWWRTPETQNSLVYLIWREPWMAIGEDTFIQSMLDLVGMKQARIDIGSKYPEINLDDFDPEQTTLLFSSEPFPFARQKDELVDSGYSCGLIDGELYSWYGVRSLKFLESL